MTEEVQNESMLEAESSKTIFDCWREAIGHFFDVKGRTTRYEFWAFQTVSLLIFILASVIGFIFGYYKVIFEVYALYFLAPAATVSVRRLHDIGISGKWIIPIVALAAIMLFCWEIETDFTVLPTFLLLCAMSYLYYVLSDKGENGDNLYGAKVQEPSVCDDDSKVFVIFMATFLSVLWIIFLIKVIF